MPSVPTTWIDLADPAVIADPYPHLAEERRRHPVAWHEPSGRFLAFSHAAVGAVLRDRRLGRLWQDRTPADALAPFNLLHRHQMMENEPPEHTRLRRPVAAAFNRGHVARLRPRVRQIATTLLDQVSPDSFDALADYAEPLPVLVIAELLGVPTGLAPQLRAWSQAIVAMYEEDPTATAVTDAVRAATEFAELIGDLVRERRARPRADLISDLVAGSGGLSEAEMVASVVLLLNAGHEASVNAFGNGAVALLADGHQPGPRPDLTVEEMLRYDAPAALFNRTATAEVEVAGVVLGKGDQIAVLLGSANRDPAVFDRPDVFDPQRDPNPHLAFGAGLHFCLGAPLARMELVESLTVLFDTIPDVHLVGEPRRRSTFVLRGYESVPIGGQRA